MAIEDLPGYLRHLRDKQGVSQSRVSSLTGLDKSLISRFETGDRTPSPDQLVRLAGAYEVDRNFMLMSAGLLELPGFEVLTQDSTSEDKLDALLTGAKLEEKRELVKHLAALRTTSPIVDELIPVSASP